MRYYGNSLRVSKGDGMIIFLIVFVWAVGFFITYPALLANVQAIFKDSPELAAERLAENRGTAMLFALIPLFWFIAPFLTGFYKHGFKF